MFSDKRTCSLREVEKDIIPCLFLLAIAAHPFVLETGSSPLIRARGD